MKQTWQERWAYWLLKPKLLKGLNKIFNHWWVMIIFGILPAAVTFLGGRKLSESVEQLLLKVENVDPALVEKIAYGSAIGFYGLSFVLLLSSICLGFVLEERKGYARIIGKLETKAEPGDADNPCNPPENSKKQLKD